SFDLPEIRGRVCCQRVNSPVTMGADMAWPRRRTRFGTLAAHFGLELPQISHASDRGGGDLAVPGGVELIEAPAQHPARRGPSLPPSILADELIAGSISVHLQNAAVTAEMSANAFSGSAVLEAVGNHGRPATAKGAVVAGIGPEPAFFTAPVPGARVGRLVSSEKTRGPFRASPITCAARISSSKLTRPIHCAICRLSISTRSRA